MVIAAAVMAVGIMSVIDESTINYSKAVVWESDNLLALGYTNCRELLTIAVRPNKNTLY